MNEIVRGYHRSSKITARNHAKVCCFIKEAYGYIGIMLNGTS